MIARVHLAVPYRCLHAGDPPRAFARWEAFVAELNELGGIVINRTVDAVNIAVPPALEASARDLARRLCDPAVIVVPRLVERVRSAS